MGGRRYSYKFEGQGQSLSYVVMSTSLHGVKLNRWDYKLEEEELARKKLNGVGPSGTKP